MHKLKTESPAPWEPPRSLAGSRSPSRVRLGGLRPLLVFLFTSEPMSRGQSSSTCEVTRTLTCLAHREGRGQPAGNQRCGTLSACLATCWDVRPLIKKVYPSGSTFLKVLLAMPKKHSLIASQERISHLCISYSLC